MWEHLGWFKKKERARTTYEHTMVPYNPNTNYHDIPFIVFPKDYWCANCKELYGMVVYGNSRWGGPCDECQMLEKILEGART